MNDHQERMEMETVNNTSQGPGARVAPYQELPECYGTIGASSRCKIKNCELVEACGTVAASLAEEPREADPELREKHRPDYRVIDNNTGELVQLTLLGAEWEQYKVESLHLSLSGGGEFIKSMFDRLVDGELTPGAIVEVKARGIVKEHAPVFKKDGHEGKTVILLEVVRGIEVLGHMTGKVEAAQNVDGEAKALEEQEPDLTSSDDTEEAEPFDDWEGSAA